MNLKKINFSQKKAKDFNILTRLYQLYAIYVLFKPIFAFLFYDFNIQKNKNLKDDLYIVAPNHISYLDVFIVNWAFRRRLAYMAKKELFKIETPGQRYVAKNIYRLGAFSVNREKPALSTIKSAKEAIKAKWNLCIFPQGGIKKNKAIENVNSGFVYFAKTYKINIVPIALGGLEEYNWKLFKKQKVNVKIGEAISYKLDEKEIIKEWSKQICELTGYENKVNIG